MTPVKKGRWTARDEAVLKQPTCYFSAEAEAVSTCSCFVPWRWAGMVARARVTVSRSQAYITNLTISYTKGKCSTNLIGGTVIVS